MSLACEPNKPTPSYIVRKIQQTNRDIGLSPIFNVNVDMTPCVEEFVSPSYYMSGATKPVTGLTITSDSTHNLSVVDNFDLTFNLTGSTQYTGYTGEFRYSITPEIISLEIPPIVISYSGITGSTIVTNLTTTELASLDNEYVITPWNTFISKCATDSDGVSGITINTSDYLPIDTSKNDYFVTVINPPKPLLTFVPYDLFKDIRFVNETVPTPVPTDFNSFLLTSLPIGENIVLTVNGLTVDEAQYTLSDKLVTITSGVTIETRDVLQVYYSTTRITNDTLPILNDLAKFDVFSVTGITTGFTSSATATTYTNIVNYNGDYDRLEVFLNENVDSVVEPVMTLNGVNLTFNTDFYKSTVVPNKLIFSSGASVLAGDIISVYYYYSGFNKGGDLGRLTTDTPTIIWSTQANLLRNELYGSSGVFTVEITDRNDSTYSAIINTGSTVYNNTLANYTLDVGPITTTTVVNYIYRIKFDKTFVTSIVDNSYTTTSYSDSGSFSIDWGQTNNNGF